MCEVERLYSELSQNAYRIVNGTLVGYCSDSYAVIAHDITVDFLLFSKSFKETYQKVQGKLEPFFASYVRKRLLGVQRRIFFYNSTFSRRGMEEIDKLKTCEESIDLIEISLIFKEAQTYLIRYFSGKINLGRLFRVCFVAFLQSGSINHVIIRKRLNCSDGQLKFALTKMRKLLRERKYASDFCRI